MNERDTADAGCFLMVLILILTALAYMLGGFTGYEDALQDYCEAREEVYEEVNDESFCLSEDNELTPIEWTAD